MTSTGAGYIALVLRFVPLGVLLGVLVTGCGGAAEAGHASIPKRPLTTVPTTTTPTTIDVYENARAGNFSPAVRGVPSRVYVPNSESNTVSVIDPSTLRVVSTFAVPRRPEHVVPSWDMRTLYVNSDLGNALTPIDPKTGLPGTPIAVDDPYNLYFTPDGTKAIVVAEALRTLDFRDPHTFQLIRRVPMPCRGPNHLDFTGDGKSLVVSCEGTGQLVRVDVATMAPTGVLNIGGSPQDVRLSPDGSVFYVADLFRGGVYVIDANSFSEIGFIRTGGGAHGLYPSRDATELYVSNRQGGSISVISFATRQVVANWPVPGGSPDMGGVSGDGTQLWLSGRYNSEVYVIDTRTGAVQRIPVGNGPHGVCLFPLPGHVSLGHTDNYR